MEKRKEKKNKKKRSFTTSLHNNTQQHNKTIKRKVFIICFYIIMINKKRCKNQVFISKIFTLSIKAQNQPLTHHTKGGNDKCHPLPCSLQVPYMFHLNKMESLFNPYIIQVKKQRWNNCPILPP